MNWNLLSIPREVEQIDLTLLVWNISDSVDPYSKAVVSAWSDDRSSYERLVWGMYCLDKILSMLVYPMMNKKTNSFLLHFIMGMFINIFFKCVKFWKNNQLIYYWFLTNLCIRLKWVLHMWVMWPMGLLYNMENKDRVTSI